jgi:integrase
MSTPPTPTLEQVCEEYCKDLVAISDLSPKSVKSYRSVISTFTDSVRTLIGREPTASDVTEDHVHRYFLTHVATNAPKSFGLYRSTIKTFSAWLMARGYLPWGPNPVDTLRQRRKTTTTTRNRRLSDAEFECLLKVAAKSHSRDFFLCLFMRLSGRRIGEVQRLRWADVIWDDNEILYDNTKARRYGQRMVMGPELLATLRAWQQAYESEVGQPVKGSWHLFPATAAIGVARKGRKRRRELNPESPISDASRLCRELLTGAGLYNGAGDSWHILRKTAVNQVKQKARAEGRGDAMELAKILADHESEATTRIYVDEQEDYERFKGWMLSARLLGDELAGKIPFLAPPVPEPTPEPVAVTEGAQVINFASLRTRRMVR